MAKNSKPLHSPKAPQQTAATRNPASTPKMRIPQIVGVSMPRAVKTMATLCHPTNRSRQRMVARMLYAAHVKAETDKRASKKYVKSDSEE